MACRDSPGGPVVRTLHFHCRGPSSPLSRSEDPCSGQKKDVGHLYLRVQGPSSSSQRARHFMISLSLCHTHTPARAHTPTHTSPVSSHAPPHPQALCDLVHLTVPCVLASWACPLLSLILLGTPDPSLRFQVTYHLLCRTFQAEVIHSSFVLIEAHIFSSSCLSLYSLLDLSSLYC